MPLGEGVVLHRAMHGFYESVYSCLDCADRDYTIKPSVCKKELCLHSWLNGVPCGFCKVFCPSPAWATFWLRKP